MLSTMPRLTASRASSAGVQWLTGSSLLLGFSHASAMMSVTCSGEKLVGLPGRGRSDSTSRISRLRSASDAPCCSAMRRRLSVATHRLRQRRTRWRSTPYRLAWCSLGSALAEVSTNRTRSLNPPGVLRARAISSRIVLWRCDRSTSLAFPGTIKSSTAGRSRQPDPVNCNGQVFRLIISAAQV